MKMFLYSQEHQSPLKAEALPSSLRFVTRMSYFNANPSLKSWAKRFLTCRLQYTANGTSSFKLVKDVLMCCDIQANPGPGKTEPLPKYPCGECYKAVRNNQDSILCVGYNKWLHAKCLRMSDTIFQYYLTKPDIGWTCASCAFTIEWFFVCRRLGRWITQNYLGTWSQSTARFARENGITKYYGKVCDGARPRYLWNVKLQSPRKHFNKDLQMVQININRIQNKF